MEPKDQTVQLVQQQPIAPVIDNKPILPPAQSVETIPAPLLPHEKGYIETATDTLLGAAQGVRDTVGSAYVAVKDTLVAATGTASNLAHPMVEKAVEVKDTVKSTAESAYETVSATLATARDKGTELYQVAVDTVSTAAVKTSDTIGHVAQETKEKASEVGEKTKEVMQQGAETLQHGIEVTKEKATELGQKAYDTAAVITTGAQEKVEVAKEKVEVAKDKAQQSINEMAATGEQVKADYYRRQDPTLNNLNQDPNWQMRQQPSLGTEAADIKMKTEETARQARAQITEAGYAARDKVNELATEGQMKAHEAKMRLGEKVEQTGRDIQKS